MCSAIPRRIALTASRLSPGCGSPARVRVPRASASRAPPLREREPAQAQAPEGRGGLRRGRAAGCSGAGAAGATGAGGGAGAAAPESMKPRMSFFVTRPPRPVPATCVGSTPCSAAIRATTGETKRLPFSLGAAAGGAGGAGDAAAATGCVGWGVSADDGASASSAACWVAGSGGASATGPPAAPPIWASFVPTSTVSPSCTRICVTIAARRARHLGVDLVGRDLEQRLVGLDVLALLLEPARDRPFRDGHAHLRHHDVDCGLGGHRTPF